MNLDSMTLAELRDLRNKVDRAISGYEEKRKREALAALEQAAREHGFNLSELTGGAAKSRTAKRGQNAAKYAHPENPELTWSGRGRRPRWVQDALSDGGKLEDMAV